MTGRLAGRCVVITGATGIAAASAHRFAAEGARLFLISRTGGPPGRARRRARGHRDRGRLGRGRPGRRRSGRGRHGSGRGLARPHRWPVRGRGGLRTAVRRCAGPRADRVGLGRDTGAQRPQPGADHGRGAAADARPGAGRCTGARGAIVGMSSILASYPEPALFPTPAYAASKGAISTLIRVMAATTSARASGSTRSRPR